MCVFVKVVYKAHAKAVAIKEVEDGIFIGGSV